MSNTFEKIKQHIADMFDTEKRGLKYLQKTEKLGNYFGEDFSDCFGIIKETKPEESKVEEDSEQ